MSVAAPRDEAAIDEVEGGRERLRAAGRAAMGVTGEAAPPLRRVLREHGVGLGPLLALSLLVVVDEFQRTAFLVLGPEISRTLGLSRGAIGGLLTLSLLAVAVAALPIAAFVERRPRRAAVAIGTAFAWSGTTLLSGFAGSPLALATLLIVDGGTTGSVQAVHGPLLLDSYPPAARVRALSVYRAADAVGRILAPAVVALCTGLFALTWRGVFLVMGGISLLAACGALRLRDPGFGVWDTQRLRQAVADDAGTGARVEQASVALGFAEIVRRVGLIPTVRRVFVAFALLGMMLVPLLTYLSFFLEERFGLDATGRAVFNASTPALAIVALAVAGRRAESLFRRDPRRLMRFAAAVFAAALAALLFGVASPWLAGAWLGFGAMNACFALLSPILGIAVQGIVPAQMRPHVSALTGIMLFGVGGTAGLVFLSGIDVRFGIGGALVALAIPGVLATVVLARTSRSILADLDRVIDDVIEEQELAGLSARGQVPPLVAVRGVDFAYDQLQVLFGVDFRVDEGEMVGLLGTNGAGKSTLLRVVSGLGIPSRGTVRFRGADITYLDPTRRVRLGISQIPGGKAVFPSLSVVENLRAFGYSIGRDRRAVDRGIEESFAAFPRLAERRNQLAGTMSGGEAQMLALSKALLLRPQVLCIDELSLGLAPKVVGELLVMVRAINAAGTAVVLVEQSVNVALSLVQRAYFMEKGEVRFEGAAAELLERGDLLRSVFLEGAAAAVGR